MNKAIELLEEELARIRDRLANFKEETASDDLYDEAYDDSIAEQVVMDLLKRLRAAGPKAPLPPAASRGW